MQRKFDLIIGAGTPPWSALLVRSTRTDRQDGNRATIARDDSVEEVARDGILMSYGPRVVDDARRLPYYVDRILKGTNPANLPVEQPSRFYLTINLKTAKAIGLSVSPSLLQRADQLIE